jgi:hypothetical protein
MLGLLLVFGLVGLVVVGSVVAVVVTLGVSKT